LQTCSQNCQWGICEGGGEASWTIFVYGHADNNLSISLVKDVQEMNGATIGSHLNVIVMADYSSGRKDDTGKPFPSGVEWYRIKGSGQEPELIGTDPEVNSDDPANLVRALSNVFQQYPADRYAVIMWDHGGSWDGGFGHDEQDTPKDRTDDGHGMTPAQVAQSLATALDNAGLPGRPGLEFLAFDTCLLAGNEVAYEFRSLAKTYLACAEMDFGDGWDYKNTFSYISNNPKAEAKIIAREEVKHWNSHHAQAGASDKLVRAHVALDLSRMDEYATGWGNLVDAMVQSESLNLMEVARKQFVSVPGYSISIDEPVGYPTYRDAGQILDQLTLIGSDASVVDAAISLKQTMENLIINNSLGSLREASEQVGLHCEMPLSKNWKDLENGDRRTSYMNLNWDKQTNWSEVLDELSAYADQQEPVIHTLLSDQFFPPVIQFYSDDEDIAEAQVHIASLSGDNVTMHGLIGAGYVEPGETYQFEWDGELFALSDGNKKARVFLYRWISGGADSSGTPLMGIYAVPGILAEENESMNAYALLQDEEATVSQMIIIDNKGQKVTVPLNAIKGASFTPLLFDGTNQEWVPTTNLTIPNSASPTLSFTTEEAPFGDYCIVTKITDVWGNTGSAEDYLIDF
jgi:hypothetical protein